VDDVYHAESRRVLATLIRLLGDFDLAEDALHDAFAAALRQWGRDGVPANPRAWLVSAGRFKAIDASAGGPASMPHWRPWPSNSTRQRRRRGSGRRGHRGRPAAAGLHLLPPGAATGCPNRLTLREVCGLTTEEIARAYLTAPPTLRQRIVGPRRRSATPASRTGCRRRPSCRIGWTPCST
jgi:RNA polymerase sigma-70 factor (ECF subfamily)